MTWRARSIASSVSNSPTSRVRGTSGNTSARSVGDERFMTYDDLLIAMVMLTESIADTEPLLRPSVAAKNAQRKTP